MAGAVLVGPGGFPDDFPDAALLAMLTRRFGGGKTPFTETFVGAGTHTILTPDAGKLLEVFYVLAIAKPSASEDPPEIIVRFDGGDELYRSFDGLAHWEHFPGAVDQPLVLDIDANATVAVTVHYNETEP